MTADDWVKIIGAVASGVVTVLAALNILSRQLSRYHREVNGRMTELLELTKRASHAEGRLEVREPLG